MTARRVAVALLVLAVPGVLAADGYVVLAYGHFVDPPSDPEAPDCAGETAVAVVVDPGLDRVEFAPASHLDEADLPWQGYCVPSPDRWSLSRDCAGEPPVVACERVVDLRTRTTLRLDADGGVAYRFTSFDGEQRFDGERVASEPTFRYEDGEPTQAHEGTYHGRGSEVLVGPDGRVRCIGEGSVVARLDPTWEGTARVTFPVGHGLFNLASFCSLGALSFPLDECTYEDATLACERGDAQGRWTMRWHETGTITAEHDAPTRRIFEATVYPLTRNGWPT